MNSRDWLSTISRAALLLPLLAVQIGAQSPTESPDELSLMAGKSILVSSIKAIERISVGFGDVAEATAVTPNEVLLNGKAPGSTSLIIWQEGGGKLFFNVNVSQNRFVEDSKITSVRRELTRELPGQNITIASDNGVLYVRGTAKDLASADRALNIAATLGKVVNLLYVSHPKADPQVLLRVRFASLDRTRSLQMGLNLFSTGATNTIGATSTGQFSAPGISSTSGTQSPTTPFNLSDLLNIFLYRKDLNLGAVIKDLEIKGILQTLAEPNVLADNGKQASFLAGGEFPYPVFQGSSGGAGAVTIQFREFGVRLNFIPTVTQRGTIKLQVAPEVSALDFANGLTIQGFNVPALTTRKVKTEVDLEDGQSFAIAGLLDRTVTDSFQKMPFIGDIPVIGKMFQTKSVSRQNTELIVVVTPEIVQPIGPAPELKFPLKFMDAANADVISKSGAAKTVAAASPPAEKAVPYEQLVKSMEAAKQLDAGAASGGQGASSMTTPASGSVVH
jgi:pilus assembly protein CpaC